jgi:exodeoxyribonuclease V gamma subunit
VVARDAHTILADHLERARLRGETGGAKVGPEPRTVLQTLQEDVRADVRRGDDAEPITRAADDGSVQVHACHGPVRQLQVLRESLLAVLEVDRSLEPRDIVVMTPDIEVYAPIVSAAFAPRDDDEDAEGGTGPPDLPVRVADRALTDDNPVAGVLTTVLELSSGRVGASEVLDLLASEPLRARFGLSAADLETLPGWLLESGVSWGIDAEHRRELIDLDDGSHTWSFGLDRWTLGAAMADDGTRMVGGVVPYDEVEGAAVELLGRVAAATDHLFHWLRALRAPRPIEAWQEALAETVTALCDPGPGPHRDAALASQLAEVRAALEDMVADARTKEGRFPALQLTLEELRGMLGERLGGGTSHTSYGTGAITVTGLVPLRNVPHRVVCLVGMDDGAIPRTGARHGFDLLESPSRPGDPDRRLEDRQLVLDAILAARDHLIITYTGHDPRTNEVRQPAAPVSELLEVLDRSVRYADRRAPDERTGTPPSLRPARAIVVRTHPLQPHSARYFRQALEGEEPVPRAFDRHHLAAARAAVTASGHAPPFLAARLAPPPDGPATAGVVELDDLVRFLEQPVRFLLRRRLGLSLGEDDQRLEDRDPLELDPLERWKLGQDLLERQLAGPVSERWREVTLAGGTVPVGGLGDVALGGIEELVDRLVERVGLLGAGEEVVPVDVAVTPPDGTSEPIRLLGAVTLRGDHVVHVGVSAPKAKHQLATWARLLAVAAARGDLTPRARLIGGDRSLASGVRELDLDPSGTAAVARLGELVGLYLEGHRAALPVLPETAKAYTVARRDGRTPDEAVRDAHHRAWVGNRRFGGERDDAYVVQAFGRETELAEVVARHPIGDAAEQIWRPLLDAGVDR